MQDKLLLKSDEAIEIDEQLSQVEPFSEQADTILSLYIKPGHYPALIDNYDNLLAKATLYENEAKRCNNIAKKCKQYAENVKLYMLKGMIALQQKRFEFPFKKLTVQSSPPSVEVEDADEVPDKYRRYSIKITDNDISKLRKILSENNIAYDVSFEVNKSAILDEYKKWKERVRIIKDRTPEEQDTIAPMIEVAGTKIIDDKVHLVLRD